MNKKEVFTETKAHFNSSDLNNDVHEIKAAEAAAINNGGIDNQLEYLHEAAGLDWIIEAFLS